MKNLFKYSLVLLSVALGFVACNDDDDDYKPGVPTSTQQVFFSNAQKKSVEISPDTTCFTFPIMRNDASAELNVPLTVTITEGSIFNAPSSVSFAAGEKQANIVFSYDPAKIEYGRYDTITVAIADQAVATQYGLSSFTFTAGVTDWGAWEKWNDAGTADYYYCGMLFSGDNPGLTFTYRHNFIKPNLYQFRLNHWGYDVDLILDYDETTGYVSIPKTYTGYTHSTYGQEFIADITTFLTEMGSAPETPRYGTFDKEQGIISIPVMYYDTEGWAEDGMIETIYINGYSRKDYTSKVAFGGKVIEEESFKVIANVTLGPDVTSAKVALIAGRELSDEVLDAILDDSYEAQTTISKSGQVSFAADTLKTGYYSFIVIPFDGEEVSEENLVMCTFRYVATATESWTPMYNGTYTYTISDLTADENGENGYGGIYEDPFTAVLYRSTTDPGRYKIAPWANNPDGMVFTMDDAADIVVEAAFTGDSVQSTYPIYASDVNTYGVAPIKSFYQEGTFYFVLAYYCEAGDMAYVVDAFTLTSPVESRSFTSQFVKVLKNRPSFKTMHLSGKALNKKLSKDSKKVKATKKVVARKSLR
jgi:hypothetical protein